MADASVQRGTRAPRSRTTATLLAVFFLALFAGFVALGTWQVYRRAWKLELIDRVMHRVQADATPAPARADWAGVNAANDEYRRVALRGVFQFTKESLVQAVSDEGSGFWVLTPLLQVDGSAVMINRGFVPPEHRALLSHGGEQPQGMVTVVGLLRMTEPGGGFLRKNDPAGDRWFSRDVAAIAAARGVAPVAPYFVDADRALAADVADAPIGGLTVIAFHNSHLVYAITWYGLALMSLLGGWIVAREELRLRRREP